MSDSDLLWPLVPWFAGALLLLTFAVTWFLRGRWDEDVVPRLRDVLRQIEGHFGAPLFAIDGRQQALVATAGWLHFVPPSGQIQSIPLTKIVGLEVTETPRGSISFRCDLDDGGQTAEFVTDNIARFASLFNMFVEDAKEIRYLT